MRDKQMQTNIKYHYLHLRARKSSFFLISFRSFVVSPKDIKKNELASATRDIIVGRPSVVSHRKVHWVTKRYALARASIWCLVDNHNATPGFREKEAKYIDASAVCNTGTHCPRWEHSPLSLRIYSRWYHSNELCRHYATQASLMNSRMGVWVHDVKTVYPIILWWSAQRAVCVEMRMPHMWL